MHGLWLLQFWLFLFPCQGRAVPTDTKPVPNRRSGPAAYIHTARPGSAFFACQLSAHFLSYIHNSTNLTNDKGLYFSETIDSCEHRRSTFLEEEFKMRFLSHRVAVWVWLAKILFVGRTTMIVLIWIRPMFVIFDVSTFIVIVMSLKVEFFFQYTSMIINYIVQTDNFSSKVKPLLFPINQSLIILYW